MSTPPLFDLPPAKPLRKPKAAITGSGAIKYESYSPKGPVNCEDCAACQLEANLAGRNYAVANKARSKRTQGGVTVLLCIEHRDIRKADEAREQIEAELRAVGPP